jgi:hypothetical protein
MVQRTGSAVGSAAADNAVADSIFTFVFTAASGDAWGGWFVADSAAHAPGSTLATAHGSYSVTTEREMGADLTAQGMPDGAVYVEWFRDAGGLFLPTRNGPSLASGFAGLGSEADAAWSGVAWDSFGAGGADQANPAMPPADSLFTWSFTAASGDRWGGVLYDSGAAFAVGDTVAGAAGTYRILSERTLAAGEEAAPRGTVRLTGTYHDAGSNTALTVQDAGRAVDAGTSGLGSETGAAWDGEEWAAFGEGGAVQADADRDSSYTWSYWNPTTGDHYGGWLIDDTGRYAAGQQIAANGGHYQIWSETPLGGHGGFANGTMWINHYHDAATGRWLTPEAWANGGAAVASRGLGMEEDRVWDGDELDWFGRGETWWVTVEQDSLYRFAFWSPATGDVYYGRLVADPAAHQAGDVMWTWFGAYVIQSEEELGRRAAEPQGTVWIDSYYDAGSGRWLGTIGSQTGQPVGRGGLGSESDWVWDGDNHDWVGGGDTRWVAVEEDSLYRFSFWSPATGDSYRGRLIHDAATHQPGDTFWTAWGVYRIEAEEPLGRRADQPWGTVYMDGYYDAGSRRWLSSIGIETGQPVGRNWLGSESDWVWDGDNHDWTGGGDTRWVNVE